MSKDIRQYLHYYIGQPYRYRYFDWEFHQWTVWTKLTLDRLKALDDLSIDGIELALRKLEDMTEEEKKALFQEVSLISLSDYDFEYGEDEDSWFVNAIGAWGVVQDSIQWKQGVLWAQNNDKSFSPINPQSDVFHYLLSKGFDLFNLIEFGIAVDSNNINK